MIRYICHHVNYGDAVCIGAPLSVGFRTFLDARRMEAWLRYTGEPEHAKAYDRRECIGIELVDEPEESA